MRFIVDNMGESFYPPDQIRSLQVWLFSVVKF